MDIGTGTTEHLEPNYEELKPEENPEEGIKPGDDLEPNYEELKQVLLKSSLEGRKI